MDTPDLRVAEVHCPGSHRGWSDPEPIGRLAVVLPRRGAFVRRVAGVSTLVDRATGYVQVPGTEQEIAHPAGGDMCTTIALPELATGEPIRTGPVHVTARVGLAHRLLVTRASAGADQLELVDLATDIAAAVLGGAPIPAGPGHSGRRIADGAREILAIEPACPLPEIARRLAVSPSYLSRVFHHVTGTTLRRYRLRLRVIAGLDLLAAGGGGGSLAAVAAEAGFADQAHLTRVMAAELGQPPGRLRSLLGAAAGSRTRNGCPHPTPSSARAAPAGRWPGPGIGR